MTTETLILLIMIVFLAGIVPAWPYSRSWGYAPMASLTILLVIFLIWAIAGDRPLFRSSSRDVKTTVQDAGQDLKSAGRDVAGSIRRTFQ